MLTINPKYHFHGYCLLSLYLLALISTISSDCGTSVVEPDIDTLAVNTSTTIPSWKRNSTEFGIVGGHIAVPHSWPWMAALYKNEGKDYACGGSLVDINWVITAAHCLRKGSSVIDPSEVSIRLGVHDLDASSSEHQIIAVEKLVIHEGFAMKTYENDVALIKLAEEAKLSDAVAKICLPPDSEIQSGQNGVVTGWGFVSEFGPMSPKLQEVLVPVVDHDHCCKVFDPLKVLPTMFCAGDPYEGKDACQGDSGGPFMIRDPSTKKWTQYGIVSWGTGCADETKPGVYTDLSHYVSWVRETIEAPCF